MESFEEKIFWSREGRERGWRKGLEIQGRRGVGVWNRVGREELEEGSTAREDRQGKKENYENHEKSS